MKHRSSLPALACVGGGILCVAIGAGVRPAGGVAASPSFRLTDAELSLIRGFDGGGLSDECEMMLTSASSDCGWTINPPIFTCDAANCDAGCFDACDWKPIIQSGGSSWMVGQITSRPCADLGSKQRIFPCDTTQSPCPCDPSVEPLKIIDCPRDTLEVLACVGP